MNRNSDVPHLPLEKAEEKSTDHPSRRGFLGSVGALGLGVMAEVLAPATAHGARQETAAQEKLSSIASLNVTRDETFHVPGGKEHFLDWTVGDENGVVKKFMNHASRVDSDVTYSLIMNIRIETYDAVMGTLHSPLAVKEQKISVFAVKGEVAGNVRNDHMTITTVYADGRTSRQSMEVPVRLDVSEYSNMDTATMIRTIGNNFVGQ